MQNILQVIGKVFRSLLLATFCFLLLITSGRSAAAFTQSPDESDAPLVEAKTLFRQSKFSEADRAVRQYLETHPNFAVGHFFLGHFLFPGIQAEAMLDRQLVLQAQGGLGGGAGQAPSRLFL